ncbi:MAG: hypothetical protein MUC47_05800 [Candidatus Kapabacteria bacterium]|nr:hypothetical protein [Candidatus Kapabacteria bacterium]
MASPPPSPQTSSASSDDIQRLLGDLHLALAKSMTRADGTERILSENQRYLADTHNAVMDHVSAFLAKQHEIIANQHTIISNQNIIIGFLKQLVGAADE